MFCLVDYMISLILFDDAFEAESAKNVRNIFNTDIPEGKSSLVLKWKREALDRPVFTEPARDDEEETRSKPRPMLARTWSNYLRRLGREAGLQHGLKEKQQCVFVSITSFLITKVILYLYIHLNIG